MGNNKVKLLIVGIIVILSVSGVLFLCSIYFNKQEIIDFKEKNNYDVIVMGGEPEGIAAAISASRMGSRTLLLIEEDTPGGLFVHGMLNSIDMNRYKNKEILTKGIFMEFYQGIGNKESFDVNRAKDTFIKLMEKETKLTYLTNKELSKPIMNGDIITGIETKDGARYTAKRIIDATADGNVCALAGTPYFNGMEDVNLTDKMAVTLVFKLGGVNWSELEKDIENYKQQTGDTNAGYNDSSAWAFGQWCSGKYRPIHENMKLRGLNIGRQEDNSLLINALQILEVDGLDIDSVEKAKKDGIKEVNNILIYLKTIIPSFKNAKILGVADELYIRETRHIMGEYVLTANDLLENKNFYDKVALGSYPVDIQSTAISNKGYVIGVPDEYSIPLRCLVPLKIDNLFIVGKAASYSSVAAGSARVVPVGMVCGESVGIAANYSIKKDITPRELTKSLEEIRELTEILKEKGIYLPEFDVLNKNTEYPGYNQIRKLINLGFICGGYDNNFNFDISAVKTSFCNVLTNAIKRSGSDQFSLELSNKIKKSRGQEELTGLDIAKISASILGQEVDSMTNEEIMTFCKERKLFGIYEDKIFVDTGITRGQMYYIATNVIEEYIGHTLEYKPLNIANFSYS